MRLLIPIALALLASISDVHAQCMENPVGDSIIIVCPGGPSVVCTEINGQLVCE